MVFSSIFFIFMFLPAALICYYLVPARFIAVRNVVLLIFSILFYAWGEPVYVILMLFSTMCNYFLGLDINHNIKEDRRREAGRTLIFAIVFNLFILGYFKYAGFLISNLNAILPVDIPFKELPLPIGISFYTFQTMSYIIDLYRGKVGVQKSYMRFALYVTMFPQLIAGPIVRYDDVEKQLADRQYSLTKFGNGAARFIVGMGKKVFLANNIGVVWTDISATAPEHLSALAAWIGIIAYTFQIYFDFSGYSDMAIGLGKMFGFEFLENFNYPYIAKSITEFWRRWHMSLSSWFKEYVYIPLGGNREGTAKQIRNILVVWLLTGLWHGAQWTFIAWGVYYGLLLLLEKFVLSRWQTRWPAFLQHLYCMLFVCIGWVFFASSSIGNAFAYLGAMFGFGGGIADGTAVYYLTTNFLLFVILILASLPIGRRLKQKFVEVKGRVGVTLAMAGYVVILVLTVGYLVTESYNPFLYFRF
ncbi:MBOAT family O-acyltransferase [Hespellia stercorisuis]|uniref:Alginate O-acetyltransferase complex protein AlgI n=1 Tax=Hespellia stercorisuis DSM 15480 TaxID=1121950 RepID=A0A1M6N9I8_9FIRM|nr:MBOAT family protein [Hespellia stercorisuis]SHJ92324.1 alginate O-acetyltransferase complex protein AlgI [Hespellia stercorisuis DSM 15480]